MAGKGKVDPREIADRRLKVARLRLAGVRDQGKIAQQLGVSRPTIVRDFQAIDADWQREYLANIQREKALDLARIDALISAAWPEAAKGSTRHIRVINELLARRAALLGADAPTKVAATDPTGTQGQPVIVVRAIDYRQAVAALAPPIEGEWVDVSGFTEVAARPVAYRTASREDEGA